MRSCIICRDLSPWPELVCNVEVVRLGSVSQNATQWPKAKMAGVHRAVDIDNRRGLEGTRTDTTPRRTEGEAGLEDRSSRPLSMPTKTSEETESAALALRQAERFSRDEVLPCPRWKRPRELQRNTLVPLEQNESYRPF